MIKLTATDMDGTLVNSKGIFRDEIFEIIRFLNTKGVIFSAASGRQLTSLKRSFKSVDNDMMYIAENGAYVLYKGEELYRDIIDKKVVDDILRSAEEVENASVFLCGKKYSYSNSKKAIEFMSNPTFGYDLKYTEDLRSIDEEVLKVSIIDKHDPRENSMKVFVPRFGETMNVVLSGSWCLDILNRGVSKGKALKEVKKHFGIEKSEVVVFGDNYNDMEMFDEAGLKFAVSNAEEAVKERADYIIGSNDDNAVVETLKKIIKENF